jgi:uncharacterized protein YdeI (YjbR/CyaY-like superfamily)
MKVQPKNRAAWRAWLEANHATKTEATVVLHKQSSKKPGIDYATAVEEALCFGWIDGVKRALDAHRYTHRFSPRRAGGKWSALNKQRIAALLVAGKIAPAGQAVIAAAMVDGSWNLESFPAETSDEVPAELASVLAISTPARRAYDALAPGQQKLWRRWVREAKQARTRTQRAIKAAAQLRTGHKVPKGG